MLISVIISVYNIKNYIEKSINSVLNQTYSNWECILVDDGSTDGSESICDLWAEDSDKISVIHKPNGGPSSARNAGLLAAKGEYVFFLDGDDMLVPQALENFYHNYEKADIVIGHMAFFYDSNKPIPFTNVVKKEWVKNKNGKAAFVEIHKHNPTFMMGARGLYNREFLKKNDLFFDEKCWYSEDQEWTVRCFEKANSISSNEKPDYLYRTGRPGSLMNTPNLNKIESTLCVYDSWHKKCICYPTEEFYLVLYEVLIKRYWNIYIQYFSVFSGEEYKVFCEMMDKRRVFVKKRPKKIFINKYIFFIWRFKSKNICNLLKFKILVQKLKRKRKQNVITNSKY